MKRLAVVSLFVCAFLPTMFAGCEKKPELKHFYKLPDFSLTAQTDKKITLADLKGKVWIADFIFTNCGGTCPMMTTEMRKLQDGLPAEIRFLSITVDPDRDTSK